MGREGKGMEEEKKDVEEKRKGQEKEKKTCVWMRIKR